jgi:hypothetical protein
MPEQFKISQGIEPRAAELLKKVLPDTKLPEGVSVVAPEEATKAVKPFVVVTVRPTTGEATEVYKAGAERYVTMDFNHERLKKRMDGEQA